MAKKRVVTLAITLGLFLLYVMMGSIAMYGTAREYVYPRFSRAMLVFTMVYVLGGCILQTLGHRKATLLLGTFSFLALCALLYYSTRWYDFAIFGLCMFLVLKRSTNLCDPSCTLEESKPSIKTE